MPKSWCVGLLQGLWWLTKWFCLGSLMRLLPPALPLLQRCLYCLSVSPWDTIIYSRAFYGKSSPIATGFRAEYGKQCWNTDGWLHSSHSCGSRVGWASGTVNSSDVPNEAVPPNQSNPSIALHLWVQRIWPLIVFNHVCWSLTFVTLDQNLNQSFYLPIAPDCWIGRPLSVFTVAAHSCIYCVLVIGLLPPGSSSLAAHGGIYRLSISQSWSYCSYLLCTNARSRSGYVPWKRAVGSILLPLKAVYIMVSLLVTFSLCRGFIRAKDVHWLRETYRSDYC